MSAGIDEAAKGFIAVFANLDFSGAPTYCILMVISAAVCMEGIKFYKLILKATAFILGFRLAHDLLWAKIPNDEFLLMAEVAVGLLLTVLAWKVYLAGVAMMVFQFARYNLMDFFDGPYAVIICIAVSVLIALMSVKLNRTVIVILTAIVGGFATVNFFLRMIPVFPVDLSGFPPASSPVWYFAKIFLSMAGVGIQGVREPGGED